MHPSSSNPKKRLRTAHPHRDTTATRLSSTVAVINSLPDQTLSQSSQKLPRTSSSSTGILSFNDSSTADVILRLFVDSSPFDSSSVPDSTDQSDVQIYLHSHVLNRSKYFDALLSGRWQYQRNEDGNASPDSGRNDLIHLNLGVPDNPSSISIHLTVLQLLYTSDYATAIDSVSTALEILPVALELLFENCVKSCVRYLEVVPWTEEEEKRVLNLIPFLCEEESKELLARVSLGKDDSCEEMLQGLIFAAINNHPNMAFVKAFVAKLLRDFSS